MLALELLPVLLAQLVRRQRLARREEPSLLTEDAGNVADYDRALSTKLALTYAAGLVLLHRSRGRTSGGSALDLACGPGHFTLHLARHLGFARVTGVDLSSPMLEAARRNAERQGLSARLLFRLGDIARLDDLADSSFDLATCTNAAHHLPDLGSVRVVLAQMDRLTRPDGTILLLDLVRLRTAPATERYVRVLGRDYDEQGLPRFREDFRSSMYAAWTADELRGAVPRSSTKRAWFHRVPRGIPSLQAILGIPAGRKRLLVRRGFPWRHESPVPARMRGDWRLLRATLALGRCRRIGASEDGCAS